MSKSLTINPTLALRTFGASGAPFAMRMTAASLAALWLGMWLELGTPRWAAWTVMSLALPTRGQVAAKGLWRVGGTIVGLVAGLTAVGLFAQAPVALGAALAAWIALNAYVGGRLSGLAPYGAALSGLTASLVVSLSEEAPNSVFLVALDRGANILIGVACVYVASVVAEAIQGARPTPAADAVAGPSQAEIAGNAIRALLVVGAAWTVWMATAWSSGGFFVVFAGVVAIFFATLPDPDLRARAYLGGALLGQGVGLAVKFLLLSSSGSFGELAAVLTPFLLVGAIGMTDPRTTGAAIGYNLCFFLAVDPANPMQYDLAASINEAAAIAAGVAFGTLAFTVVLPGRVWRAAR